MLKLSILDQSPISEGMNSKTAINNTIELAKFADINGYSRFWVSEHHSTKAFASASPEIFISSLAAQTNSIRVGSAGVLLSHYSPFKIAEQFNLLTTLYPDRIDLGIGRALGGDAKISKLLNSDLNSADLFDKYDKLINFIYVNNSQTKAIPETEYKPEFWVLGSSPASAKYAAERGLRYSFASFINSEHLMKALQVYHQYFTPSRFLEKPYTNLSLFALCAEDEGKANELAKVAENWLVNSLLLKKDLPFPKNVEDESVTQSMPAQFLINMFREYSVIGSPEQVINKLKMFKSKLMIDEFTIVTITHDQEDKINSYKLIAEENMKGSK
jgi:luciferase family oxidoreductase group 1